VLVNISELAEKRNFFRDADRPLAMENADSQTDAIAQMLHRNSTNDTI
jgi:hypothetical protein